MTRLATLLLLSAPLLGCAASPVTLSDGGRDVRLATGDPTPGCEEIGNVEGDGRELWTGYGTMDSAKNDLRNRAAAMGANFVRMEIVQGHGYRVSGTAYRCP